MSTRLVADIGGTHCRFAISDEEHALAAIITFETANYPTLNKAIAAYLERIDIRPDSACLAVAGPVTKRSMRMTNLNWEGDSASLNQAFGFKSSVFINDFEAIALSIPVLPHQGLISLGGGILNDTLPIAVIGPGTGLGVAQLLRSGDHYRAIATEGGHASLQAQTDIEQAIFEYWRKQRFPLSRESFLSGNGLQRLYQALCSIEGVVQQASSGAEVSEMAKRGNTQSKQALAIFLALLGSAAGDQALACGARGGVVLAGGILPKLQDALISSDFRARFENKPPMQHYLRGIGTQLIVYDNPGLLGAAMYEG